MFRLQYNCTDHIITEVTSYSYTLFSTKVQQSADYPWYLGEAGAPIIEKYGYANYILLELSSSM
jgi:hypothetical protein